MITCLQKLKNRGVAVSEHFCSGILLRVILCVWMWAVVYVSWLMDGALYKNLLLGSPRCDSIRQLVNASHMFLLDFFQKPYVFWQ